VARGDKVLLRPSSIRLDGVQRRCLDAVVMFIVGRDVGIDPDDMGALGHEDEVQGKRGVFHPECVEIFFRKGEEHSLAEG